MKLKVSQKELVCNLRYARCCDYIYAYTEWLDNGKKCEIITNEKCINDIKNDKREYITLYCKTDPEYLNYIFKQCYDINKKIILITGCSDIPITKNIYDRKPNNIIKWYGENINYDHTDLIPIPMGTLSGTWIGNKKEESEIYNHEKFKLVNVSNKEPEIINLAFMCFSIETNKNHREKVYNYFNNKNWVSNLCFKKTGKYLNDDIFMHNVYNHHFIISPFGNGIDCGRTWMALQLGCIPILPYHIGFKEFAKELPILLYNDISELTEDYLHNFLKNFQKNTYNYDLLKTSYWKKKFENNKLNI
jgi:hypothetical protein